MRTWMHLWFEVIGLWVSGLIGVLIVARLNGDKGSDVLPFLLFYFVVILVNAIGKELYERLKNLQEHLQQMGNQLDELERESSRGEEGDI